MPTADHHLTSQSFFRPRTLPSVVVSLLLVLPWVQPWAPGPDSDVVPMLVSWAVLGLLVALGQLPTGLELARAWAWAAVLSSLIGLVQYFGEAVHLGGWAHILPSPGMAFGNLRQRNHLATHLAIGIVAVLWWHRQGLRTGHALWMLALMACATAATNSRTGLLQMLVLPALLGWWAWFQSRSHDRTTPLQVPSWRLALVTLGLYLLANGALPELLFWHSGIQVDNALARLAESSGCSSRRVLWANVLELIAQHPWIGWGWDDLKFVHYMTPYAGLRFCDILGNAHNLPLHLAVTLGVPVATIAVLMLLLALWRAHPWRLQRSDDALAWGALSAIGIHSLLEYPLWYGPFQVAAICATVLLWPTTASMAFRRFIRVLALVGLCMVPLITWDYLRVRQVYLPPPMRSSLWKADPWGAARQTWFFNSLVRFAMVTVFPVTPDNARAMLEASLATLHEAPEPRIIDKVIDSARLLGQNDLADWHQAQKQKVYGQPAP